MDHGSLTTLSWNHPPTPPAPTAIRPLFLAGQIPPCLSLIFMLNHARAHQNPLLDFLLEAASDADDFLAEVARFFFVGRGWV